MSERPPPLVSVGMPAYNSERTIAQAIECILNQDLQDLELVVSDNASSDRTWQIVQGYAARDPRVVPLRQAANIGANGNYTAVLRAARGRYFKWTSSSDWCAPSFLSRCIQTLEQRPDAVLVSPRTFLFTHDVDQRQPYADDRPFDHDDPVQRFKDVTLGLKLNNVLNGVVRTQALRRTRAIEHYRDADVVLVKHLALLGKLLLLDEALFGRRMDEATATRLMSAEAVHAHHYPTPTARALLPSVRFAVGSLQAVGASDLGLQDRLRAVAWIGKAMRWRWPVLRREFAEALRYPLR
jgi:glycosyltransferase involved in cell wall biosynthesis